MNEQQYTHLIRRLELDSHADPAGFRRRVMLVSVAAYAAICGTLILAVLLAGAALWLAATAHLGMLVVKLALVALVPLVAMLAVLRVFFMRIPAPEGRRLQRQEAPALFDMLERMRTKLDGPRIDHVLVDERYNAAIAQCPRFGLFGGHANYLILGLPYMLGTPTKEMLATIAHEYGHLCGSHGKLGAWVYRQRRVFGALAEQIHELAEDSVVHRLLARVLGQLMPHYNAYTFVLSRQNEYDADRTATDLVGAVANAQGLVRDTLQGRWMNEHFWPTLFRHADRSPQPPFLPFAAMKTAFRAGYAQWAQPELLAAALAQRSDVHDTHPCLRERLEATGEAPALPRPAERTAADTLLPADTQRALVREFDEAWWARTSRGWTTHHRRAETSRARLAELAPQPLAQLKLADVQELALLKAEFETDDAAKPVLRHLLAQPGGPYPLAAFHYGRILLGEGDAQGLRYLEEAAAADRTLIEPAASQGHGFLLRTRDERAAQQWLEGMWPQAA